MRRRRSEHARRGERRVTAFAPHTEHGLELTPLAVNDLLTFRAEPCPVTPGTYLAGARCLVCSRAIGGEAAVVVALVSLQNPPRPTGALTSRGYLAHVVCAESADEMLHAFAHRRECPDCQCSEFA